MKFNYKGSKTVLKDKNVLWKFYVPMEKRVNDMVVDNKHFLKLNTVQVTEL